MPSQFPSRSRWAPVLLRASIFVDVFQEAPALLIALFEAIAGAKPEKVEGNPRVGSEVYRGEWRSGELRVSKAPGRIDVVLSAVVEPTIEPTSEFSVLGQFEEEKAALLDAVRSHVLAMIPDGIDIIRVALGGSVVSHKLPLPEAVSLVNNSANLNIDAKNASDIIFQVNNFMPFRDGRINKIIKWATITLTDTFVNTETGVIAGPPLESNFAKIDYDYNTAGVAFSRSEALEALEILSRLLTETYAAEVTV
jgi:hypothetical protein